MQDRLWDTTTSDALEVDTTVHGPYNSAYEALGYPDAAAMKEKSDIVIQIQQAMESHDMSRHAAAKLIGISPRTLARYLRGRFRKADVATLKAGLISIATELGQRYQVTMHLDRKPRNIYNIR